MLYHDIVTWLESHWDWWIVFGFCGQGLFMMRFLYQWVASEKAGKSVIPLAFWYFSILGGVTTFIYALHREDPVFIFGQGTGLLIYIRNLQLVYRERRRATISPQQS